MQHTKTNATLFSLVQELPGANGWLTTA